MPHRIICSWYTGRWLVGCYIWRSEEGTERGRSPLRPLLAVPNVTAHQSMASVLPLLYNGALLCGFNVPVKGLLLRLASATDAVEHCALNCRQTKRIFISRWYPVLKFGVLIVSEAVVRLTRLFYQSLITCTTPRMLQIPVNAQITGILLNPRYL